MQPRRNVALLIETSRGYGRGLLMGVAQYIRVHGPWTIEFEEGDLGEGIPEWFKHWRGDGVIARVKTQEMARFIARLGVPVVDLYGCLPKVNLPLLRSDEEAVGRLAAQHLLERGFRQFAFCGHNGVDWSDLRRRGFERQVTEAGFKCLAFQGAADTKTTRAIENEEHDLESERRLGKWLQALPKPIGLMAHNDLRGRQVLHACRALGVAVPDDVAVIGVDRDEVLGELSEISLSSVVLDTQRIGFGAAALLDRLMTGEQMEPVCYLVEPKGIASKQSTDVLAVEDRAIAAALNYIREHACDGVVVSDLLKVAALSRRSFERRFAQSTGRSPKDEILQVQLNRAKELLADSDLPLSSIADKAGFHYAEYMSRIFKKKTGMTPSGFREQSRPAPPRGQRASMPGEAREG